MDIQLISKSTPICAIDQPFKYFYPLVLHAVQLVQVHQFVLVVQRLLDFPLAPFGQAHPKKSNHLV